MGKVQKMDDWLLDDPQIKRQKRRFVSSDFDDLVVDEDSTGYWSSEE